MIRHNYFFIENAKIPNMFYLKESKTIGEKGGCRKKE